MTHWYNPPRKKGVSKYNAKPCIVTEDGTIFVIADLKQYGITDVQGIRFDSKMEAEYYLFLKEQMRIGQVKDIVLQPKFILQDKPKIQYIADFKVTYAGGEFTVIDVKGKQTSAFKLKKRLFAKVYEDYKLLLVTKKNGQWVVVS